MTSSTKTAARGWVLIGAAALLSTCAQPMAPTSTPPELAGRAPGSVRSCVSTSPAHNLRALDAQTLSYEDGQTLYINHLGAPCPGLDRQSTLIVQQSIGNEYCRGDEIRAHETGVIISGPACFLGDWQAYTGH